MWVIFLKNTRAPIVKSDLKKNLYSNLRLQLHLFIGTHRIFKKVQAKKLVKLNKSIFFPREIAFLAVLKLFPSSKIDFWPFLKLQKKYFCQKFFSEIDSVDFTSFFGLDFFRFSGSLKG